jgi:DNA-binding XRE family transcriptional regulator
MIKIRRLELARLTDQKRKDILNKFHVGWSQNKLAKEFEVSPATINKLCKGLKPKLVNEVNSQIAINTKLSSESECQVNTFDKEVNDRQRRMGLVFGGLEKLAQKASIAIDKGKAQKVVSGKFGTDVVEHDLQSSDYKNYADALEKVGKSLGVIENKADVEVNTQQITGVQLIDS